MHIYKSVKQDIFGMARVGSTSDKYEIYVNTNDGGKFPHFHYRDAKDWKKFHTCIRIDVAEYFLHEGKEDKLNAKQLKNLYKFLKSDVTLSKYRGKFKNNYELICFLWDLNNSDVQIPENIDMPDYLHELNI